MENTIVVITSSPFWLKITKNNMNILIIHEIDMLRTVTFEYQTWCELLSLQGHNVYVIDYESLWDKHSNSKYQELRVAKAYPDSKATLIRPPFIKIPILSRVSAFFSHYKVIEKTIKEKKIDTIILYSVPTNGLQTIYLAKKYHIPVYFRSIDILHKLVHNPILSCVTKELEKYVYSHADLILTISPKLSDYVKKLGAKNVRYLALGVDTNVFKPHPPDKDLREKWGIKETDKVIVFVGTLPTFSGLDNFLKVLPTIQAKTNAKFMIVGDGIQRSKLERIIKKNNLDVIITGYQPYADIPKFINLADICVNTFPILPMTNDIFPTKVIQYLACGKPVVSTKLAGIKALIKDGSDGVLYSTNFTDMAGNIIFLLENPTALKLIGNNGLRYVKQNHDYGNIIRELESILHG